MTTTRVVTWNMGNRARRDDAWHYLLTDEDGLRADIALVQEAQIPDWATEGFTAHWAPAWTTKEWGTAIVVRSGIELTKTEASTETARYVAGRVSLPCGDVFVASIHALTDGAVIPPLREVFDALRGDCTQRFIIGGDFNTGRSADEIWPGYGHLAFWEELDEAGFVSAYHAEHGQEALTYAHPRGKFRGQADHILLDAVTYGDGSPRSTVGDERGLSDHKPLVVELTWP